MMQTQTSKAHPLSNTVLTADLSRPVMVEQNGQPVAVLISIAEFEQYQALLASNRPIAASEARRAADRAVFGDLVGCALSSGDPIWVPEPQPHWRVPYRLFDGTLLAIVHVDAYSALVAFTAEERAALFDKVEHLAGAHAPA